MIIRFDILRRSSAEEKPYLQSILLECGENETVALQLLKINSRDDIRDTEGNNVGHIMWEHSCMQKKCGACAMLINGVPRLACKARLKEFSKNGCVRVEPLRKFPVVADLLVDRSAIFEQLRAMSVWAENGLTCPESTDDTAYEASRCLQCGCCLEVCPNFCTDECFFGTSSAVAISKLIAQLEGDERTELEKNYRRHFYSGCGKSLACRNICPAGIDIEMLMVNSNSAALWKRIFRKKK